jgi:hypothetical protein
VKMGILIAVVLALVVAFFILAARTQPIRRQFNFNSRTVNFYAANGRLIKTYQTVGKVYSENGSDGWFFVNKETGKLTMVTGFIEIVEN